MHFNLEEISDLPGREDLRAAGLLDPRLPKDFEIPEPMMTDDVNLDDEQLEAAQRDRQVELRVKFNVHGMHGRLKHIHPIIADGKAKKLATANWKSVQTIHFD